MATNEDPAPGAEPGSAIVLSPSLDLTAADALLQAMRAGHRDGVLLLDGGAVERVSTPCLQVLAAAATAARQGSMPFRIVAASPALTAAIADLGLTVAIPLES